MTTLCPGCEKQIEVIVTHQGTSSDGAYQRAVIEATHTLPVCDSWKTTEHDLVVFAAEAR